MSVPDDFGWPRAGDLMVTRAQGGARGYTISRLPGAPQAIWKSRDAAIDLARDYARRSQVDAWYSEERFTVRISHHRSDGIGPVIES